jgi:hypothetical protein
LPLAERVKKYNLSTEDIMSINDYSLAADFKFSDVERMLANVPVTRNQFFNRAGISEQCWWDWKRTDRISKHSKHNLSEAYKYFRSKEYETKQAEKAFHMFSPSKLTIEDLVAELERKGCSIKLEITMGIKESLKPIADAINGMDNKNDSFYYYKEVDDNIIRVIPTERDTLENLMINSDIVCTKDKKILIKNNLGTLDDLSIIDNI